MDAESQRQRGRDGVLSTLNMAIEDLNCAREISSIAPTKVIFGSVSALLAIIRDSMVNRTDHVELGLICADVCRALDRGINGRQPDQFSRSVFEAIGQLTTIVAEIERDVIKLGKRNAISRLFHSKDDKERIAAWRSDLNRVLHVFNTELAINSHIAVVDTQKIVFDIHRTIMELQEETESGNVSTRTRILGELPPSPPRACFGRKQLIKKIIDLAENVTPIALIGAGGIGKTSVSLAVLHHDRIKARFGDNRRFIRCDQFPASCTHFLARLSQAVGAGIDNPKDLTTLRQSLSSKEMLIVLDNAESILDPQGADGQEIYDVVEELSQFSNVCLVITSRITTIPPNCETLKVPTLSTGATHDTFYHIYKYGERSGQVNDILKQLDFHPLSVALLATVAHQNQWDNDRLAREWKRRRTDVLRTEHQTSLAATIELSLASPLFRALGPDARGLLEVVAFYPQGVNENNLNWFFPTIPNVTHIFDKLCILSLIYRSNGFITMLAPLRDYLRPNDPKLSPLICTTKERYFVRLAVEFDPNRPEFKDTQWFVTEDVNVEHLLDIFTFIDPDSDGVWDACIDFMRHLDWYKPRQTVLRPKIEALPDNHPSKPGCLSEVALLLGSVGNYAEGIRLLNHALKIERERKNHHRVALILESLSHANRMLGLRIKGIHQAKEASEIYERLGKTAERARCLDQLARLLHDDGYLDAAEEAAVHSTKLLPEKGHEFKVCLSHCTLGDIYCSKGQREKAIHHYEVVLLIASSFNWHGHLFWTHFSLAELFFDELAFDDARAHVEKAGSHALNDLYLLGRAAYLQASILHRQHRFKDATFEVLHALEIFEKVGSLKELEACRALCQDIERGPPFGEPPETAFCSTSVDSPFSAHDTLS